MAQGEGNGAALGKGAGHAVGDAIGIWSGDQFRFQCPVRKMYVHLGLPVFHVQLSGERSGRGQILPLDVKQAALLVAAGGGFV